MSDKYNNIESPGNPISKHNFDIWPDKDTTYGEKIYNYYTHNQIQKLKKQEEEKKKKKKN